MSAVLHHARWVLPVSRPPLADGAVVLNGGSIQDVGLLDEVRRRSGLDPAEQRWDLILPGLVNAHTHLSVTGLRDRVPRGGGITDWLSRMADLAGRLDPEDVAAGVDEGVRTSLERGTVLVGEITTRPEGAHRLRGEPRLWSRVFFEFLGVTAERAEARFAAARDQALAWTAKAPEQSGAGLSPHAPYSVWPSLWERTAGFSEVHALPWSTHLAEPPGEEEFLTRGTGELRRHLERLGVWDGTFPVPGTSAVKMLAAAGALNKHALLVHGVHLTSEEIEALARAGAHLCLCPRSNAFLGLPPAPVMAAYRAGLSLAVGTDSAASNHDLGVLGELRALRELAPELPPAVLLAMGTRNGARALGFGHRLGTVETGKASCLLGVASRPGSPADPWERLFSPEAEIDVRRLDLLAEGFPA